MTIPILMATALVPMLVGMLWYSKMAFGTSWMNINGFTDEDLKKGNMLVIMGLSYVFSFFVAFSLMGSVIHQMGVMQLFAQAVPGSEDALFYETFIAKYGDMHRSFGHGAFHGLLVGLFFISPLIAINALFERRSWKYIGIHAGYWIVTLAIMGGVLGQFMPV